MNETVILTPDQVRARKRRNVMLALCIGAFMLLVFFITLSQMQAGVAEGLAQ